MFLEIICNFLHYNNAITIQMNSLPIVPFGKYKGQPITSLLNDTKYLEWCKLQEWFQKFPVVYNICVNQTLATNNQNTKTPEHNQIQNLFLENKNVEKLLRLLYEQFRFRKNVSYSSARSEFEGSFNWDIIINNLSFTKIQCKCDWDEVPDGHCCDCTYEDDDDDDYALSNIYIEVKPLLGDDYPCVLRKMKLQRELTNDSLRREKQEMLDDVGYIKGKNSVFQYGGRVFEEVKKTMEYVNKNSRMFSGHFILLIGEFNSSTTSKEKLIAIFDQSFIKIVFVNELFTELTCKVMLGHKIIGLEEESKLRRENLINSEKKIKQLEELLIAKTHKAQKSMKDFYAKK